jgi:hypothetical protein
MRNLSKKTILLARLIAGQESREIRTKCLRGDIFIFDLHLIEKEMLCLNMIRK